eukprot:349243-Amphidinium_carterae.1
MHFSAETNLPQTRLKLGLLHVVPFASGVVFPFWWHQFQRKFLRNKNRQPIPYRSSERKKKSRAWAYT